MVSFCGRKPPEEPYSPPEVVPGDINSYIKNRLDVVLAAQVRYSKDYHIEEGWGKVIHTYMSKRKLTKEMADAFVDSIIIHGKYDYEIKLVYDDQFADLQKLKKEKEAQSR